jgi:hypothetical protein
VAWFGSEAVKEGVGIYGEGESFVYGFLHYPPAFSLQMY